MATIKAETIVYGSRSGQDWQAYTGPDGPGVSIWVDTTEAGFPYDSLVSYVCSLTGKQRQWVTTGGSCVYEDTPRGFRVYVRRSDGGPLTPKDAREWDWSVTWLGCSRPSLLT
jgi:hypothetical protein